MDWLIATTDRKRSDHWDRVFGRHTLPVKSERPLGWIVNAGTEPRRAYELDAARLHPMARARFAATLVRRLRVGYSDAMALVDGWLIDSSNCELETVGKRPFATRFDFTRWRWDRRSLGGRFGFVI